MEAHVQQLTKDEQRLFEEHTPIVRQACGRFLRARGPRYDRADILQAGFLGLTEALIEWRDSSARAKGVRLEPFLFLCVRKAAIDFANGNYCEFSIPAASVRKAISPPDGKGRAVSDKTRKAIIGRSNARVPLEDIPRLASGRHKNGKPIPRTSAGSGSPGGAEHRDRVRAAIVKAASRYGGAKGDAADLLLADFFPISNQAYRRGFCPIAASTGLAAHQVASLAQRILRGARREIEGDSRAEAQHAHRRRGAAIRGAVERDGERARRAIFQSARPYARNGPWAAILAAVRVATQDKAIRPRGKDVAAWTGVSVRTFGDVERRVVTQALEKLGVAA